MPEPKTFWIAREWSVLGCEESVTIFTERPRLKGGDVWICDSDAPYGWISPEMFASVGLPREPLPGECWEVTWNELRPAGQLDDSIMVPIARNVTEELKEANDG